MSHFDDSIIGPYGHDYTQLCRRLNSLRGGKIIYVQCPGNAGDAVITTGTLKIFDRIGLPMTVGNWDKVYPDADIVFAGGGNLVPYYGQVRAFVEANFDTLRSFTLLPSSVRGHEDLLSRMDDRFELHAREWTSHQHLMDHAAGARVFLSHDMAFANEFDRMRDMLATIGPFRMDRIGSRMQFRQSRAYAIWLLSRMKRRADGIRLPSGGKVLNAYRTDDERVSDAPREDANTDISKLFSMNHDEVLFLTAAIARKFVDTINRYDVVRTDRLHVAIAATMLGKTVRVGDNSYGKIEAVRAHSMGNFTNIRPHRSNGPD